MTSIFWSANYDQLVNCFAVLQRQLSEQEWHIQNQFQLLDVRLKYLVQCVEKQQENLYQIENEKSRKWDLIQNQVKHELKMVLQDKVETYDDLEPEFKELDNCKDKLKRININNHMLMEEQINKQLIQISDRLKKKQQDYEAEIISLNQLLKKQVENTEKRMEKYQENDRAGYLMVLIEDLKTEFTKMLSQLKQKRKQKRQKFLKLLQTIVIKCKSQ